MSDAQEQMGRKAAGGGPRRGGARRRGLLRDPPGAPRRCVTGAAVGRVRSWGRRGNRKPQRQQGTAEGSDQNCSPQLGQHKLPELTEAGEGELIRRPRVTRRRRPACQRPALATPGAASPGYSGPASCTRLPSSSAHQAFMNVPNEPCALSFSEISSNKGSQSIN